MHVSNSSQISPKYNDPKTYSLFKSETWLRFNNDWSKTFKAIYLTFIDEVAILDFQLGSDLKSSE